MSDLLDRTQQGITKRLSELRPAVEEFERLQAAVVALEGVAGSTPGVSASTGKRRPGRPRGSRNRAKKTSSGSTETVAPAEKTPAIKRSRGASRPKVGGSRAIQVTTLVAEHPGITIVKLAERMGINRTYLYRVLPGLELEGKIVRRGSGWHSAGS